MKKYITFDALGAVSVLGGLRALFIIGKGVTFTQFAVMLSIYNIIKVIAVIPSGVVSDYIGKKTSLIFGTTLKIIYYAIIVMSNNLLMMYLAYVSIGLADTILANAKTSYIHDLTKNNNGFDKLNGKSTAISTLFTVVLNIIGGFIYDINSSYIFIMVIAILVMSLVTAFTLEDIEVVKQKLEYTHIIKEGFDTIRTSPKLRSILMFTLLSTTSIVLLISMKQPYLAKIGITGSQMGILDSMFQLTGIFAASKSDQILRKTGSNIFTYVLVCTVIASLIMTVSTNYYGVASSFMTPVINIMSILAISSFANKELKDGSRTTSMAFIKIVSGITIAILLPFVGKMVDTVGLSYVTITIATTLAVLSPFVIININKNYASD